MLTARQAQVAIAGASVTGLHAAHLLADRGRQVVVLERSTELDPVPRTLIVTSRYRDYLGLLGEGAVLNRIDRFELFAGDRMVTVPLTEPDLIIERATLINALAKEAVRSGAELRFGHRVDALTPREDSLGVEVSADGERAILAASTVVGADGVGSRIARAAGWGTQRTAPLVQALVPLPEGMTSNTTRVWFRPEDTPYFYWLIPESDRVGALGIIGDGRRNTRAILDRFLEELGLEPLGYQAAKVPVGLRWRRSSRRLGPGRVHLLGDAAGHVKVSTVGGIVTGARGVLGVVGEITDQASRRELTSLKRELAAHTVIRAALNRFKLDDYVRLLDLVDDGILDLAGRTTRDQAPQFLLSALRAKPKLVSTSVRALASWRI
jgi:flavin-dependent dehydrogenase